MSVWATGVACRSGGEPMVIGPAPTVAAPIIEEPPMPSAIDRLSQYRWHQIEERWTTYPEEETTYPFQRWPLCVRDDEYVFTATGGFWWYSGATVCSDTYPVFSIPVDEEEDLYPGRSHRYELDQTKRTIHIPAMHINGSFQFKGDTLLLQTRSDYSGLGDTTFTTRTLYLLPVR